MKVTHRRCKHSRVRKGLLLLSILAALILTIPNVPLNSDYSYVVDSLKSSELGTYRWRQLCDPPSAMTRKLGCESFDTIVDGTEYRVYLLSYSTLWETWKARYDVNSLNRRMGGLHFEAFTYRTLLISVYPSDQHVLELLRQIVGDSLE